MLINYKEIQLLIQESRRCYLWREKMVIMGGAHAGSILLFGLVCPDIFL